MEARIVRDEGSSTADITHLMGAITFDGQRLGKVLPRPLAAALQRLGIGGGYTMEGAWMLQNSRAQDH